jgi:hypothetical protein
MSGVRPKTSSSSMTSSAGVVSKKTSISFAWPA